ncbi:Rho GTPase activating protein 19 [Balamuthia mandrillaris]
MIRKGKLLGKTKNKEAKEEAKRRSTTSGGSKRKRKTGKNGGSDGGGAASGAGSKLGNVFGRSLEETLAFQNNGAVLPNIVSETITWLEQNKAVEEEGLFRIPGQVTIISELKAQYDKKGTADLSPITDIASVAGLLKLYLRELPEPLFLFRFYSTFIKIAKNDDTLSRIRNLRILINGLPELNKTVAFYILKFLNKVVNNRQKNLMTSANLAMIFAPNLLRSEREELTQIMNDAPYVTNIMKLLIEEVDYVSHVSLTSWLFNYFGFVFVFLRSILSFFFAFLFLYSFLLFIPLLFRPFVLFQKQETDQPASTDHEVKIVKSENVAIPIQQAIRKASLPPPLVLTPSKENITANGGGNGSTISTVKGKEKEKEQEKEEPMVVQHENEEINGQQQQNGGETEEQKQKREEERLKELEAIKQRLKEKEMLLRKLRGQLEESESDSDNSDDSSEESSQWESEPENAEEEQEDQQQKAEPDAYKQLPLTPSANRELRGPLLEEFGGNGSGTSRKGSVSGGGASPLASPSSAKGRRNVVEVEL